MKVKELKKLLENVNDEFEVIGLSDQHAFGYLEWSIVHSWVDKDSLILEIEGNYEDEDDDEDEDEDEE